MTPREAILARGLIRGRTWSPFGKVAKVEYSLSQGKSWQTARLREPNIAAAWVRWDFDWEPKPGKHTLRSAQPTKRETRSLTRFPLISRVIFIMRS